MLCVTLMLLSGIVPESTITLWIDSFPLLGDVCTAGPSFPLTTSLLCLRATEDKRQCCVSDDPCWWTGVNATWSILLVSLAPELLWFCVFFLHVCIYLISIIFFSAYCIYGWKSLFHTWTQTNRIQIEYRYFKAILIRMGDFHFY